MKQLILIMFLAISCRVTAQPQPVQVRDFTDYYFVGNQILKPGVNCFVLTDWKEYKKFFADTPRPDTPDFGKEWMLVLLMPKTKWHAKLDIQDISMKAGGFIEVYCKVNEGNRKLTYDFYPIKVCAIPKYKGIGKINFYSGKRMTPLASVAME